MPHDEFRTVLENAMSGSQKDLEKILKLYKPLIDSSSYVNGRLNEDLRQYIVLHIIKNISKFKI